jgi:prepilin-type processing-associated H-X9-DG protein
LDETEFAPAYICPGADLEAVYAEHADDKYHACYWTNVAVRVNRGWNILFVTYDWPPGWDLDSHGAARYFGLVCPNDESEFGHWRTVYHPRLDTIQNPAGMVFVGDTRNTPYDSPYSGITAPGDYHMRPGWGWFHGYLGFDRHKGSIMLGYVDGHAKAFPEEELEEYSLYWFGEATGDFTLNYLGDDGCGGTRIHSLPDRVGEVE